MVLRTVLTHAKKHPALIPLFVIIGSGGIGASLYLMRLAMFNPDVSWDKKNNPEPWNKMAPSDQYKEKLYYHMLDVKSGWDAKICIVLG